MAEVTGASAGSEYYLVPHAIKDAVEVLASKNVPRLGETYVCFVHPHQSRRLRDTPEWIEVTKYAAPGNFMLGEIGRLDDVVFIETTQIGAPVGTIGTDLWPGLPGGNVTTPNPADPNWRGNALGITETQRAAPGSSGTPATPTSPRNTTRRSTRTPTSSPTTQGPAPPTTSTSRPRVEWHAGLGRAVGSVRRRRPGVLRSPDAR